VIATRRERTEAAALVAVKELVDAKTPITAVTLAGFALATRIDTRYLDASGALVPPQDRTRRQIAFPTSSQYNHVTLGRVPLLSARRRRSAPGAA
jgi:hypothetical protein